MSKSTEKSGSGEARLYTDLQVKALSGKTIIGKASKQVPGFKSQLDKFEQQITLGSYSKSTLHNYARAVAGISLHFKKDVLSLDDEEINSYLFSLSQQDSKSDTYFKHCVYGLRFFFRMYDREDRALKLPSLKGQRKLPVVLSGPELKRLFLAPQRQKQRIIFALIYSAGLRISELQGLTIGDIDFDRKCILIQKGKGDKARQVILSDFIAMGLKKYLQGTKPRYYLFNGKVKGQPISTGAIQQSFRLARKKAGIAKECCVHSLRHSFATHLLEHGTDIVTIKELLGHADITTTMMYLHIAHIPRSKVKSPLDILYAEQLASKA